MKTLGDVREFLSGVANINQGGCAVAALAMKRWLTKFSPKEKTSIIYTYGSLGSDNYLENEDFLNEGIGEPSSCLHSYLLYHDKCMDCNEVVPKGFLQKTHIFENEEFVVNSLNNIGNWNPCFKREKAIPIIEKRLNIDLSDILQNVEKGDIYD